MAVHVVPNFLFIIFALKEFNQFLFVFEQLASYANDPNHFKKNIFFDQVKHFRLFFSKNVKS